MPNDVEDEKFMRLALEQAVKANPSPNPRVGALIVKKGEIIGKGYHTAAGMPHAEIEAMKNLSPDQLRGSTLYVTLEPCNHYGKTAPCADAIIHAGISRVVFGAHDSNPKVQGEEALAHAGIDVKGGVLEKESREMNKFFFFAMENSRPHVTLKWAMTADGKLASKTADSKWITGDETRMRARQIRAGCDAVLVGVGTIIADNPTLGGPKLRIILDSHLRTPPKAKIFATGGVVLICEKDAPAANAAALQSAGAKIVRLNYTSPRSVLSELHKMELRSVFVEGGGETHSRFVEEKIYDRIIIYISPKLVGGREAKTPVEGEGMKAIPRTPAHSIVGITKIGNDVEIVMEETG